MKIYGIEERRYGGKGPLVVEAEATARPETYKLSERIAAFGYSKIVNKSVAHESPEAAINAYISRKEGAVRNAEFKLRSATDELDKARKLRP